MMIKFFYNLFNHDKLNALEKEVLIYKERVEQLEKELREYKGYKLKYQVAQMLVDDDPAIDEILTSLEKIGEHDAAEQRSRMALYDLAQQQSRAIQGMGQAQSSGLLGMLGGIGLR